MNKRHAQTFFKRGPGGWKQAEYRQPESGIKDFSEMHVRCEMRSGLCLGFLSYVAVSKQMEGTVAIQNCGPSSPHAKRGVDFRPFSHI